MTARELRFAELYIQTGNAVKAAVGAGYSEKTARFASNWLNPQSLQIQGGTVSVHRRAQ